MRWLKYQSLEDYDGGRGGREGRGRRPVQTGHYKANICLIQSLTETSGSASTAGGSCVQRGLQKGDMKEGN